MVGPIVFLEIIFSAFQMLLSKHWLVGFLFCTENYDQFSDCLLQVEFVCQRMQRTKAFSVLGRN